VVVVIENVEDERSIDIAKIINWSEENNILKYEADSFKVTFVDSSSMIQNDWRRHDDRQQQQQQQRPYQYDRHHGNQNNYTENQGQNSRARGRGYINE